MAKKKSKPTKPIPWAVIVLAAITFYLVVNALTMPDGRTRTPSFPKEGALCEGDPIEVGYEYDGEFLQPHECKVQCNTDRQRYILYTNGMATQCEPLPGCNDWGEDNGVTCTPPMSQ